MSSGAGVGLSGTGQRGVVDGGLSMTVPPVVRKWIHWLKKNISKQEVSCDFAIPTLMFFFERERANSWKSTSSSVQYNLMWGSTVAECYIQDYCAAYCEYRSKTSSVSLSIPKYSASECLVETPKNKCDTILNPHPRYNAYNCLRADLLSGSSPSRRKASTYRNVNLEEILCLCTQRWPELTNRGQ